MISGVGLLFTPYAMLPMCIVIKKDGSVSFVSVGTDIAAIYTRFVASIAKVMLLITNSTAAISAACPVIEIVIAPVITCGMFRSMLLVTGVAYFLMYILT